MPRDLPAQVPKCQDADMPTWISGESWMAKADEAVRRLVNNKHYDFIHSSFVHSPCVICQASQVFHAFPATGFLPTQHSPAFRGFLPPSNNTTTLFAVFPISDDLPNHPLHHLQPHRSILYPAYHIVSLTPREPATSETTSSNTTTQSMLR
jgi:hypothetical protein